MILEPLQRVEQIAIEPIDGHTGAFMAVAISRDSAQVCSGSDDETVCIWDIGSGKRITGSLKGSSDTKHGRLVTGPFKRSTSSVGAINVSCDGKSLVLALEDGTMRIWDTDNWQTRSLFRNTRVVRSFTFWPDSSRFVSGSLDENMRIWEVPGATIKQAKGGDSTGYGRWVTPVSFSHCGSYIVSKSHDMTVHTWNIQAGQPTYTALMEQKEQILSVGFSPDSSHIYPVSRDRMVYVWQRQSRKLEYTIGPIDTDGDYNPWYNIRKSDDTF
ncbi:N-terminal domain of NWD NACHT-NTPase [Rhizoctonia solani]|uniref:N-terminal domain of NWD NACHT-NTPase n=1 Tax=Rhizoctonia solani TaxID=456999 RepID=A0A8H7I1K7_9AGAM|nr:N-terminal domain of NWD NACHT-NTPase [Rhizoctonia solani]